MNKHPHLRLVDSNKSQNQTSLAELPRCNSSAWSDEQLCLDFEFNFSKRVAIVAMEQVHGKTLLDFISGSKPEIVIDLRHALRFNIPGTNREQIFHHFNQIDAYYVNVGIPWHSLNASDFMVAENTISLRLNYELIDRSEKMIMIMIPKVEHVKYIKSYINRKLSENFKSNWFIQEVY